MATTKVDILQVDTTASKTSVKELRTEMESLQDNLLNLDKGTADYNATLQRAADIQKTLKDQTDEVNAASMDTSQIFSNASSAVAGMTGAFQTGVGVMNMFGVESEASMEMISKMQNIMSITSGFQAIASGVDAFKNLGAAIKASALFQKLFTKSKVQDTAATVGHTVAVGAETAATTAGTTASWAFNASLLANPIMWVVAGIMAAVAAIGVLIYWLGKEEESTFDVNAELQRTIDLQDELASQHDDRINRMKAEGKTEQEIAAQKIKDAKEIMAADDAAIAKYQADTKKKTKEQKEAYKELLDQRKKHAKDLHKAEEAATNLEIKTTREDNEKIADENTRDAEKRAATRKAANDKLLKDAEDKSKREIELVNKTNREIADANRTDQENELLLLKEQHDKKMEAYINQKIDTAELEEAYKQQQADINKKYDDQAIKAEKDRVATIYDINKKTLDDKLSANDAAYENAELTLLEQLDQGIINEEAYNQRLRDLQAERLQDEIDTIQASINSGNLSVEAKDALEKQLTALQKEQTQKRIEDKKTEEEADKKLQEGKLNTAMAVMNAMGGLMNAAADLAEEGSKEQKALKIGGATIDMIGGAVGAYMSAMTSAIPTPFNMVVGAMNAATVVASGIANIKKMAAVKIGNSSGGGANIPSISMASLATTQAPVQATTQVTGASVEDTIQDTRVYVVESDITNTQRKVSTAEAEATF